MPLEIKELHINVSVNQAEAGKGQQQSNAQAGAGSKQEELIKECVEQVLNTIQQKKER